MSKFAVEMCWICGNPKNDHDITLVLYCTVSVTLIYSLLAISLIAMFDLWTLKKVEDACCFVWARTLSDIKR